jgi:iron complex outermembrane receptor protein
VKKTTLIALRAGAAPIALGLALSSAPAWAQDASNNAATVAAEADDADDADDSGDVILVTGTLFSRADTETASPVTSLSSETLAERGINTVAEAVQRIPSNNAGTIQQGWNTGFNFASGANAPALRGLTVQSTLSIADGLRMAPYPLADDGQRNFVDLNTIPQAIVDRIEILRDGASSTYGADAIAGVINVITKKEVQGLHLNASAGVSERGDAGEGRADATWGYGDLADQGFNFYISGEWQKQEALWARDRDYPFNTADWSQICSPTTSSCMHNLNWNAITPEDGFFNALVTIPGVTLVRPYQANGTTTAGSYSFLNPAAGCRGWDYISGADVLAQTGSTVFPQGICEVNFQSAYQMLQPEIERMGLSGRVTVNVSDRAQVYAMVNWYDTKTHAAFTPLGFNGSLPPPNNGAAAFNVWLPDYVCAAGVGTTTGQGTGCTAANGVLNPYNPYAGTGLRARAFLRSTRPRTVDTNSRALRGVIGITGSFGDDWNYTANFTASENRLRRNEGNYIIPQRLADAVARGQFNFSNPEATPQSVWDFISPLESTVSVSELWQAQATLAKELFELPGGPLQVAVGLAYREESIDAPSANPGTLGNQYERYYSINAVGTAGGRNVQSGFYEISAPILDSLELSASGRYDRYSSGQKSFSPKFGAKFTPIRPITVRGTWSKGFRIPSFNEAFGLPTTGYITQSVNCATYAAFCAAHANNAYAAGNYPLGLTTVGNPALDPERSTAFTLGAILEPMRNVSFTVDYWHIKVKDLIGSPAGQAAAIAQYYSNNGVVTVPGYNALPGVPDPAFPNALPLLGFLESSFTNQDSEVVSGLDFGANIKFPVTDDITFRSVADASWLMKYALTRGAGGAVERYEGTLSPCNITSCSGAPEWRASWQNSIDYKDTTLSLTAYYTQGYDTASVDYGGVPGDCQFNADNAVSTAAYVDGTPVNCRQGAAWNVDFNARQKFGDKFTLYVDVLNIFGIDADFDPSAAYAIFGFNPAWQGPNVLGRYFRVGAKVDF